MVSFIKILTIITYSALATTNNVPTSRILELGDNFLNIYREGQWLVMMYTPWSADCKKIEPIWGHVAQYLHATSIIVGRVDCTRFTSVAQTFKVKGFPTIMFFKGDQQFVYNGDRTRDEIVQFAHSSSGPPVQEVTKTASFNNFTDHHILADKNKLNETLYKWDDAERYPTFRKVTRGVMEENQLKELHSTCTDCKNCLNCMNCKNCTNCKNCRNCTNCTNCTDCEDCTDCSDCTNCTNYCKSCATCNNCKNCTNCTNCSNCRACLSCSNCKSCTSCRNCTSCAGCTNCTICTNCLSCTNCNNCKICTSCTNSTYCSNCKICASCKTCSNCTNCTICTNCANCRDRTNYTNYSCPN